MIKKLLVPLDQSQLSEEALGVVRDLLDMGVQEVTLLSIAEAPKSTRRRRTGLRAPVAMSAAATGPYVPDVVPASDPQYVESRDQAVERREYELMEYLGKAGQPLVNRKPVIHAAVHFGDPAKEIVAFAKREGIDLIVMATHGRSGLGRTLHGSVTSAVIASGVAPVLVVRPKAAKKRTRKPGNKTKA